MKIRVWLAVALVLLLVAGSMFALRHRSSEHSPVPATTSSPATTRAAKPHDPMAVQMMMEGMALQHANQFREAISKLEGSLKIDPSLVGVRYQIAVARYSIHDYDGAGQALDASLQVEEMVPESHTLKAVMLAQVGRHADAVPEFREALKISPKDARAYYNLSETLRVIGDKSEPVTLMKRAVQLQPGEPLYAYKLRAARIEAGEKLDEIRADTAEELKLTPPTGDWLMTAAALAVTDGNLPMAQQYLAQARTAMSPALMFAMLQDPIFLKQKNAPELREFFQFGR